VYDKTKCSQDSEQSELLQIHGKTTTLQDIDFFDDDILMKNDDN